jgi:hypothetical protein
MSKESKGEALLTLNASIACVDKESNSYESRALLYGCNAIAAALIYIGDVLSELAEAKRK